MKGLKQIYVGVRNYFNELDRRAEIYWRNSSEEFQEERRLKDISRILRALPDKL